MYVMRPKGLTAICVISIVLAGLGFIAVTGGLFWWFYGEQFVERMYELMNVPQRVIQQQTELQQPMYDELETLMHRWAPVQIAQTVLHAVLIVLLLAAAIRGLKMRKGAGTLLATAMVFAILFELARIYPTFAIQHQSNEISMRHTQRMMQSTTGNPAQTRAMMTFANRMQRTIIALTYLIVGGWILLKLIFYGLSLWYVSRRHVNALFDPPPDPTAPTATVGRPP